MCAHSRCVLWLQSNPPEPCSHGCHMGATWVPHAHMGATCEQVYCILSAIRERKKSFVFTDGSVVALDPRVGFFITMNPGGWVGRWSRLQP